MPFIGIGIIKYQNVKEISPDGIVNIPIDKWVSLPHKAQVSVYLKNRRKAN